MDRSLLPSVFVGIGAGIVAAIVTALVVVPKEAHNYAIASSAGAAAYGKQQFVPVLVDNDPNGPVDFRCKVLEPLQIRAANGDPVGWTVKNNCNQPVYVQFLNFREKDPQTGDYGSPLNPPLVRPLPPAQNLATNQLAKNTTAMVGGTLQGGQVGASYKYDIQIGPDGSKWPVVRDPDIDIWPVTVIIGTPFSLGAATTPR